MTLTPQQSTPQPRQINMVSVSLDIEIGHVFQTSLSQSIRRSLAGIYGVNALFDLKMNFISWHEGTWNLSIAVVYKYSLD